MKCEGCGYEGPALEDWGDATICRGCADDAREANHLLSVVKHAVTQRGRSYPHRRMRQMSTGEMARLLGRMERGETP